MVPVFTSKFHAPGVEFPSCQLPVDFVRGNLSDCIDVSCVQKHYCFCATIIRSNMDQLEILSECVIKIENVKQEAPDHAEEEALDFMEGDRTYTFKSEMEEEDEEEGDGTYPLRSEAVDEEDEEELKPLARLFLDPEDSPEEEQKEHKCPVPSCGHRFTTIYNLKAHRKLHERPANLQCPVVGCDAHFQTKRAVEMHIKKHSPSYAPYQCTYAGCGKRYYSSSSQNGHAHSHHREEEVHCQWPDCGKWFDKPYSLKAHMRIHTGDKPYLCTFQNCSWAFSSASKLRRHQRKHTNERKFRCSVEGCGKSFMRSEHLKEHTQTHIGERCYQCTVENCGVKFTAKSSLYVHLKKHKQQMKDAGIGSEGQPAPSSNASQLPPQKSKQKTSDLLVPKWESVQNGEPAQVLLPGGSTGFPCPVESCPKSYSCKASLRQHLLKHHTPVLDLLTAPQVGNMLVVTQQEAEEGEACLQDDTSAATRVLLTSNTSTDATASDHDRELHLATESISDPLLVDNYEQSPVIAFNLDNLSDTEVDEIADDPTCQAARKHLTYQDVVQRKRQQYSSSENAVCTDNKVISSGCDNSVGTIGSSNAGTCGTESALTDAIVGL